MIPEQKQQEPQPSLPSNQIEQKAELNQGQIIDKVQQAININSINNVIYQQTGFSSNQTSSSKFKKEAPFLPYLVNRQEQEAKLSEIFYRFLKQDFPAHLVCIIHGDESQCHYEFLRRMHEFSLPKWIKLELEEPIIRKWHLDCPTKFKNSDDFLKQLEINLAEKILNKKFYCSQEINDYFSNYPNPVIIHTHLLAENLHQSGCESLDTMLKFCQQLNKEITKQKLIICICIKYKIKRKTNKKISWARLIVRLLKIFFKKNRYQRINKKLRQYLQTLDTNCFQPLSVIVLPELEGVNRGDVENWVRSQETQDFVGEAMIEPLIQKVGEMFESWEDETSCDTIPMFNLTEKLKSLIAVQGESA